MKKLFSIVALAALATLAFTSCDKDKDKEKVTPVAEAVAGDYAVYCDIAVTPNEAPAEEGDINFTDLPATLKLTKVTDSSVKFVLSGLKLPGSETEIPIEVEAVNLTGVAGNAAFTWKGELTFSMDGENEDTGDAEMKGTIVKKSGDEGKNNIALTLDLVVADKEEVPGYAVKVVMDQEEPTEPEEGGEE